MASPSLVQHQGWQRGLCVQQDPQAADIFCKGKQCARPLVAVTPQQSMETVLLDPGQDGQTDNSDTCLGTSRVFTRRGCSSRSTLTVKSLC